VRAIAGKYFPRKTDSDGELPPISELAKLRGDTKRGSALFAGKASCIKCHRVGGEGAIVGPDLTEIYRKFDRMKLLDAIVNPSAAILFGYDAWLIATVDGKVVTGTILGEGDPLIVVDTDGKQLAIPHDQIDERHRLSISMMPETTSLGLKPQDLADLAEFLLNRREAKDTP
jgi:putative heme-binding domain-containing protein